ncbi:glucose-6-phosphate dehydrogenase [Alkalilimnicola ehrlichii]|uniref:Glucose-6-phosphate 1-dehydrogenase n=1 Tax=Alkalilimnicola ehrlichii TaxID=351052 RepID=A0A3E0WKF6_9GAMM|nr:glucose-6-phosphate dehydrogenase [Alkalilimnicola ehrlichii]RFA25302.1 glucose-6-phosphate dehydrogenase [Alkalilimnicola ehrlichii]RFA32415.1 glucose-6-phosphate dehydrogenase [Alkalilimnicola ehrlichii]
MHSVNPFEMVLFGGNGDLVTRKIIPALYYRFRDDALPDDCRITGAARRDMSRDEYLALTRECCKRYLAAGDFSEEVWESFAQHLDYLKVDATAPDDFQLLARFLSESSHREKVYYLATAPDLFTTICTHLGEAGLATPESRVVLEKPLGRDLESAGKINREVAKVFKEHQIYRIDHYLGKEAVQNLIALRFGNALFEPLWQRGSIRDVQITLAEQVGVEGRGPFYDNTGALRDMVQNHLLQLLCIIAMEPPASIDPDAVRDEKLKVLRALRPLVGRDVVANTVRGQYRAGAIGGTPVRGYLDEDGIASDSHTESFVALKAEIDSWRWAGVPFFLRTGKRLQERLAEIVVTFRQVPHSIFSGDAAPAPNRLVIRLQPDDGVQLMLMAKEPGDTMDLRPVSLDLNFSKTFGSRKADAYERLLMDCLRGKLTLFMRRDEVDAAWRWVEPILDVWEQSGEAPKPYTAGTWGPAASSALMGRSGFSWREES